MKTRQLPASSILLTQYALCKFILISTEFLTLLSSFSSSASGLLSTTRLPILEKWVSPRAPHCSIPHTPLALFFLSSPTTAFFSWGEIEPSTRQARATRTHLSANKIIPPIFGYLLPGTSIPYFFPLSSLS